MLLTLRKYNCHPTAFEVSPIGICAGRDSDEGRQGLGLGLRVEANTDAYGVRIERWEEKRVVWA